MGKLFVLRCVKCKHSARLHSGMRCRGYLDGKGEAVIGDIKACWGYCSCRRTKLEIEEAAESRRFMELDKEGA